MEADRSGVCTQYLSTLLSTGAAICTNVFSAFGLEFLVSPHRHHVGPDPAALRRGRGGRCGFKRTLLGFPVQTRPAPTRGGSPAFRPQWSGGRYLSSAQKGHRYPGDSEHLSAAPVYAANPRQAELQVEDEALISEFICTNCGFGFFFPST